MPNFLGRLIGLSFRAELMIMNVLGLVNSTLDWSPLKWTNQLEKIWNLSLSQESLILDTIGEHTIKTILSWVVITRIIIAHVYTFTYVTNIYTILTWRRPNLLLPWMILSFFKNVILEVIVIVIGLLLWYEQRFSILLFLEFVIVKIVPLSLAIYNWYTNSCFFLHLKHAEKLRRLRRMAKSESNLSDSRLLARIEESVHTKNKTKSLTTLISSGSLDTNDTQDDISEIIDDPDLTPKEKTMKILGITDQDIFKARERVRERVIRAKLTEKLDDSFEDASEGDMTLYLSLSDANDSFENVETKEDSSSSEKKIATSDGEKVAKESSKESDETKKRTEFKISSEENGTVDQKLEKDVKLKQEKKKTEADVSSKKVPKQKSVREKPKRESEELKAPETLKRQAEESIEWKKKKQMRTCCPAQIPEGKPCSELLKKREVRFCPVFKQLQKNLADKPGSCSQKKQVPSESCESKTEDEESRLIKRMEAQVTRTYDVGSSMMSPMDFFAKHCPEERKKNYSSNVDTLKWRNPAAECQIVEFEDREEDSKDSSYVDVLQRDLTDDNILSLERSLNNLKISEQFEELEGNAGATVSKKSNDLSCILAEQQNVELLNTLEIPIRTEKSPGFLKDFGQIFGGCYEKGFANNRELMCLLQQMERKNWNFFADHEITDTMKDEFPKSSDADDKDFFGYQLTEQLQFAYELLALFRSRKHRRPDNTESLQMDQNLSRRQIGRKFHEDENFPGCREQKKTHLKSTDSKVSDPKKRKRFFYKPRKHSGNTNTSKTSSRESLRNDKDSSTPTTSAKSAANSNSQKLLANSRSSSSNSCVCKSRGKEKYHKYPEQSQKNRKNPERNVIEDFGTMSLAQVACSSGFEKPKVRGKPPVYPRNNRNKSSEEKETPEEAALKRTMKKSTEEKIGEKESKDKQRLSNSKLFKSRKQQSDTSEEQRARQMRALKAYNKATLVEDKKKLESKKREAVGLNSLENRESRWSSERRHKVGERYERSDGHRELEISYDDHPDKENLFSNTNIVSDGTVPSSSNYDGFSSVGSSRDSERSFNLEEKYPCSKLMKMNKVTDILVKQVSLYRENKVRKNWKKNRTEETKEESVYRGSQARVSEILKKDKANETDVTKRYPKYGKPKKKMEEEHLLATSSKRIEEPQNGRELDRTPAKEDVRERLVDEESDIRRSQTEEILEDRINIWDEDHSRLNDDARTEMIANTSEKKNKVVEDGLLTTVKYIRSRSTASTCSLNDIAEENVDASDERDEDKKIEISGVNETKAIILKDLKNEENTTITGIPDLTGSNKLSETSSKHGRSENDNLSSTIISSQENVSVSSDLKECLQTPSEITEELEPIEGTSTERRTVGPLDLREITRNIHRSYRSHGIILTNKNLRLDYSNDNDESYQRDIVDDNVAVNLHKAFYSKDTMIVRTFLRRPTITESSSDPEDPNILSHELFNDDLRRSSSQEFVCQPSNEVSVYADESSLPLEENFDQRFPSVFSVLQSNSDQDSYDLSIVPTDNNMEDLLLDNAFSTLISFLESVGNYPGDLRVEFLGEFPNNEETDDDRRRIEDESEDVDEENEEVGKEDIGKLLDFEEQLLTDLKFPIVIRREDLLPTGFTSFDVHREPSSVVVNRLQSSGHFVVERKFGINDENAHKEENIENSCKHEDKKLAEQGLSLDCFVELVTNADLKISSPKSDRKVSHDLKHEEIEDTQEYSLQNYQEKEETGVSVLNEDINEKLRRNIDEEEREGTEEYSLQNYQEKEETGVSVLNEDINEKLRRNIDEEEREGTEEYSLQNYQEKEETSVSVLNEDINEKLRRTNIDEEEIEDTEEYSLQNYQEKEETSVSVLNEDINEKLRRRNIDEDKREDVKILNTEEIEDTYVEDIRKEEEEQIPAINEEDESNKEVVDRVEDIQRNEQNNILSIREILTFILITVVVYVQCFYNVILSFSKSSKSTNTLRPFDIHTVSTSTSSIFDHPSRTQIEEQEKEEEEFDETVLLEETESSATDEETLQPEESNFESMSKNEPLEELFTENEQNVSSKDEETLLAERVASFKDISSVNNEEYNSQDGRVLQKGEAEASKDDKYISPIQAVDVKKMETSENKEFQFPQIDNTLSDQSEDIDQEKLAKMKKELQEVISKYEKLLNNEKETSSSGSEPGRDAGTSDRSDTQLEEKEIRCENLRIIDHDSRSGFSVENKNQITDEHLLPDSFEKFVRIDNIDRPLIFDKRRNSAEEEMILSKEISEHQLPDDLGKSIEIDGKPQSNFEENTISTAEETRQILTFHSEEMLNRDDRADYHRTKGMEQAVVKINEEKAELERPQVQDGREQSVSKLSLKNVKKCSEKDSKNDETMVLSHQGSSMEETTVSSQNVSEINEETKRDSREVDDGFTGRNLEPNLEEIDSFDSAYSKISDTSENVASFDEQSSMEEFTRNNSVDSTTSNVSQETEYN